MTSMQKYARCKMQKYMKCKHSLTNFLVFGGFCQIFETPIASIGFNFQRIIRCTQNLLVIISAKIRLAQKFVANFSSSL